MAVIADVVDASHLPDMSDMGDMLEPGPPQYGDASTMRDRDYYPTYTAMSLLHMWRQKGPRLGDSAHVSASRDRVSRQRGKLARGLLRCLARLYVAFVASARPWDPTLADVARNDLFCLVYPQPMGMPEVGSSVGVHHSRQSQRLRRTLPHLRRARMTRDEFEKAVRLFDMATGGSGSYMAGMRRVLAHVSKSGLLDCRHLKFVADDFLMPPLSDEAKERLVDEMWELYDLFMAWYQQRLREVLLETVGLEFTPSTVPESALAVVDEEFYGPLKPDMDHLAPSAEDVRRRVKDLVAKSGGPDKDMRSMVVQAQERRVVAVSAKGARRRMLDDLKMATGGFMWGQCVGV